MLREIQEQMLEQLSGAAELLDCELPAPSALDDPGKDSDDDEMEGFIGKRMGCIVAAAQSPIYAVQASPAKAVPDLPSLPWAATPPLSDPAQPKRGRGHRRKPGSRSAKQAEPAQDASPGSAAVQPPVSSTDARHSSQSISSSSALNGRRPPDTPPAGAPPAKRVKLQAAPRPLPASIIEDRFLKPAQTVQAEHISFRELLSGNSPFIAAKAMSKEAQEKLDAVRAKLLASNAGGGRDSGVEGCSRLSEEMEGFIYMENLLEYGPGIGGSL